MTDFFRLTRRDILKGGALMLAHTGMGWPAAGALDPSTLTPFVDPLPIPRIAKPAGSRASPERPGEKIPYYPLTMREIRQKVHRDLPATLMWGFEDNFPGPTIETQSGQPMMVEWVNSLPNRHFLPIDHTLHGAEKSLPEVRSVIHLHGGRTPADSDGYPENWVVPGKSQTCFYPCEQDAALLFYHDHSMGINRLNIYAGMQGLFIVRDPLEAGLQSARRQVRDPAADLRSPAAHRRSACLSGVPESRATVGAGGLRQRHPGERQAAALSRGRAAEISAADHERIEWTLLIDSRWRTRASFT